MFFRYQYEVQMILYQWHPLAQPNCIYFVYFLSAELASLSRECHQTIRFYFSNFISVFWNFLIQFQFNFGFLKLYLFDFGILNFIISILDFFPILFNFEFDFLNFSISIIILSVDFRPFSFSISIYPKKYL